MSFQSTDPSPTAYSYVRFSHPSQLAGDSLRRQTERAEAYCKRRGWTLDRTLTLRDMGVSAFRGKNALVGNLGVFLEAVKRGTVQPGSALIVESVDRISRQGIDEGYDIVKGILKAGIILVTLSPEREFDVSAVKSLTKGALELQLILERAAEESERKSDRLSEAWGDKKRQAREGKTMTERLPAWIRKQGHELVIDPHGAEIVRRIFALAGAGYGIPSIIKQFEKEGIAPIGGRAKHWTRSYLGIILKDRRALGELQPKRGKNPDGAVIRDYYPPVVTQEEYDLARAGQVQRRTRRGRTGERMVNLFAHLLVEARTGEPYQMTTRTARQETKDSRPGARKYDKSKERKYGVLINAGAEAGRQQMWGMPYDTVEGAVLALLREIDPHEILNGDRPPVRGTALSARLQAVEAELSQAQAFMEANGFSPTIGKRITDLEVKQRAIAAELAEARQEAASPLSECWGEVQSLAEALATAADPRDARLRLRTTIRRIVDTAYMLVVPRGYDRVAAIQIAFAGGKRRRDFLVYHWRGGNNRKSGWEAKSWTCDELRNAKMPAQFDLRHKDPTLLGVVDEPGDPWDGVEKWVAGWADVERDLLAVDLKLVFRNCERHDLP